MIKKTYDILNERFGSESIHSFETTECDSFIIINPTDIQLICMYLRYNPSLKFFFFSNLSGVDYPDKGQISLVYHLFSKKLNQLCILKAFVSRDVPEIGTIESVWKAAGWFEREVYDLLGVHFLHHSNLKRILLPEDWKGYPLRKDYKEEPVYHDMETTRPDVLRNR